jgi:hypothetical protein
MIAHPSTDLILILPFRPRLITSLAKQKATDVPSPEEPHLNEAEQNDAKPWRHAHVLVLVLVRHTATLVTSKIRQ